MKDNLFGSCPYYTAQKVLQGKWSMLIIHHLENGPIRFNELLRMMPDMTHTTLSKQLKQLENYKLIIRKEYPQVPPKVEYYLSDLGYSFLPVWKSMKEWGVQYINSLSQ